MKMLLIRLIEQTRVKSSPAASAAAAAVASSSSSAAAPMQSAQIVKALNMVMLKVLESADRTTVFHVLIKFLR